MVIIRSVEPRVQELLDQFPAVALLGPRQIGKTTLALSLSSRLGESKTYLDLELPSDLAKMADPEIYLSQHEDGLVIIDEIHRLPGIFAILRGLIDKRRRQGRRGRQFLLLGSASIDLLQQSSESLAGRIAYQEMTPFLIDEVPDTDKLWARGGFPESYLAADEDLSYEWRTQFIKTYLERDVPALGPRIPPTTLRRYWQMLAHNQSQMLNAAQVANGLGISGQTVARYLDIMGELLLVRRLQPWAANSQKRLVKTPKVYVRDTGLLHALLGIRNWEELQGHPIIGASWEGFVIENILDVLPPTVNATFYRTSAGAEIDLILEWEPNERWAIEVKRSTSNPRPSKGFYIGCQDLQATQQFVLYPGDETYHIDANTQVMNLRAFLTFFQSAGSLSGPAKRRPRSTRAVRKAER